MCMSSSNFKGFCFNAATTTHKQLCTCTHSHRMIWMTQLPNGIVQSCTVHHTDDRHSSASARSITLFHKAALLIHEVSIHDAASGDCVLWRYLVHTSGCVTLTCLLEREAHQTTIYTFRPLSCLPAVHACISRIGVTTVTDWASAFACIHPNEMINTHLTRLIVMLVDV